MTPHPELEARTAESARRKATERKAERMRLVLADWGEGRPTVICALNRDAWEELGEEERLELRAKAIEALGLHEDDFEVREVDIELESAELERLVATPTLTVLESREELCGRTVAPFRAQCVLPKGHPGECSPARPSEVPEEAE